jgi:hypothetical protein
MSREVSELTAKGAAARRESRFRAGEQPVRVVFERSGGDAPCELDAELLDFSVYGTRLLLSSPARFHEAVTLRLENDEIGLHISVAANVCWIRKHDAETWRLGCAFEPALPEETLEELFRYRVLDRRQDTRLPVHALGAAQWELSREPAPVQLVDLSEGGCCLQSPVAAPPNSRLVLYLDRRDGTKIDVAARTQWQVQRDNGWLIGCQFVSCRGHDQVRDALGIVVPKKPPAYVSTRGLTLLTLLGIVAIISWYCTFILAP